MTETGENRTTTIRDLNDRMRKRDPMVPGRMLMTVGVQALLDGDELKTAALLKAISDDDRFDADNDPYGEHDLGAFAFDGQKLFWKIDAYAPDMLHGSEDPADITKTVRVLTIMLAEEY
ncbi:hypothetical protein CSC94_18740 [Zhengella mangrovi]|uniref:DUF3768 domain-containing protein n=1 Tax=Zhengella mangrovi TaxID=1982044 RepID=A0A2G1QIT4_9HYPH|nr:DUF3768 domain-containing protein [Zhengella mangrovi]PHP65399.1 hypothetical protein CSC94_18740 [Zhengella mangrovi]